MPIKDKLLGCLVGAAAGDALGAATEMRTRRQIEERFNGPVRTFLAPPDDTFARGSKAGQVTDDFSLAYETVLTILDHQGRIDESVAKEALIRWGKTAYFEQYAGPTTRLAIQQLLGIEVPIKHGFKLVNDNAKATNGAAMKIAPIALFCKGDIDQAILDAFTISKLSHDNQLSISGACAIAAATAKALHEDSTLGDLLEAGLYGARRGEEIGMKQTKTLAGPSVTKRIELAIKLGRQDKPLVAILDDLADIIGAGLAASEAVPCVFGIIAAIGNNPEEAILAGVNIGNDTDTIATMVGGILGTFHGLKGLPQDYLPILEKANNYALTRTAETIEGLLYGS